MSRARNTIVSCFSFIIVGLSLIGLYHYSYPYGDSPLEEYTRGRYGSVIFRPWSNHQVRKWLGSCGPEASKGETDFTSNIADEQTILEDEEYSWKLDPIDLVNESDIIRDIPGYVLEYAPLVHLFSGEEFWPSDIAEHLTHVTPNLNYTPIQAKSINPNLTNLDKLNEYSHGRYVYLKSDDNVEERPEWLASKRNIPNTSARGDIKSLRANQRENDQPGRSDAPAVLIVINKGNGIVDAFWFYFYSYNLGNIVLNIRFGNHVGDWEHSLVRFQNGKPKVVFFSEHNFGSAYSYEAVEKIGKRVS